jgi:hypothetical protein
MTTCLTCSHWQPKKSPSMARLGFAQCEKKRLPGHTTSATAPACTQHKPVDSQTAAKRAEFMKGVGR